MASSYTKVFTNPYPSGWKNLPNISTPIMAQALQQHTNAIVSIEDYLANHDIPTRFSDLINDTIVVPTKLSELSNDVGYITIDDVDIPDKLSDLFNDVGYITIDDVDIPDRLSAFLNDTGYINNATTSLLYYYTKLEVYNKTEVNNLIRDAVSNTDYITFEVVDRLPTTGISDKAIYLVPKETDDNTVLFTGNILNFDNVVPNNPNTLSIGTDVYSIEEEGDPFA